MFYLEDKDRNTDVDGMTTFQFSLWTSSLARILASPAVNVPIASEAKIQGQLDLSEFSFGGGPSVV